MTEKEVVDDALRNNNTALNGNERLITKDKITECVGVDGVLDDVIEIGRIALPSVNLDAAVELGKDDAISDTGAFDARLAATTEITNCNGSRSRSGSVIHEESTSPTTDNDFKIISTSDHCTSEGMVIDKLTLGFLMNLLPEQESTKKQLNDIIQSQNVLIETVQQENTTFRDCHTIKEVAAIMDKAKIYQSKLINIKKEMMSLHEKTSHLKKRSLKLQQQKQKEALHREHARDEELEKEKKLTAKVVIKKN